MKDFLARLAEINQLYTLRLDYAKTLALLAALKSGSIKLEEVQLTADGWNVIEVTVEAPESPSAESV